MYVCVFVCVHARVCVCVCALVCMCGGAYSKWISVSCNAPGEKENIIPFLSLCMYKAQVGSLSTFTLVDFLTM